MSLSPQKFREVVFQLLYSCDFGSDPEVQEMLMAELRIARAPLRQAVEMRDKIIEKKEEIDALISKHSESYAFDRIPRVERNIVRLGIYELLFAREVPPKVVIVEALRLSRKFATAETVKFVNALLDAVYHSIEELHAAPATV
jgi:N utilization substance protein B